MSIPGSEFVEYTSTYPNNGKDYTSPFEVNVYSPSEPYIEGTLGAFICKGMVLGLERTDDGEEGATIIEITDSAGEKETVPGFFFELVPVDADTSLTDATPRISYEDFMASTPTA
jgi:hypothetical protein